MSEPPAKGDMDAAEDDADDAEDCGWGLPTPRSAVSAARASIGSVDLLGDALARGGGDGLPKLAKPNGSDDDDDGGACAMGCAAYGAVCVCAAVECCGGGANAKSPMNGWRCGCGAGDAFVNAAANGSIAACGRITGGAGTGADGVPPASKSNPAHGDAADAAGAGAVTTGAGAARPPSKSSMLDVAGAAALNPGITAATGAPDA